MWQLKISGTTAVYQKLDLEFKMSHSIGRATIANHDSQNYSEQ